MQPNNLVEVQFHIEKATAIDIEPYGFRFYASSGDVVRMRFINDQGQIVTVSVGGDSLTLCCYGPTVLLNEPMVLDMSLNMASPVATDF